MIDMEHSTLSLESVQVSLPIFDGKLLRIIIVPGNNLICINVYLKIWINLVKQLDLTLKSYRAELDVLY